MALFHLLFGRVELRSQKGIERNWVNHLSFFLSFFYLNSGIGSQFCLIPQWAQKKSSPIHFIE